MVQHLVGKELSLFAASTVFGSERSTSADAGQAAWAKRIRPLTLSERKLRALQRMVDTVDFSSVASSMEHVIIVQS